MSHTEPYLCEYELPSKPFQCCKRKATMRIERNGYYCSQHGRSVLRNLRRAGVERDVERLITHEEPANGKARKGGRS